MSRRKLVKSFYYWKKAKAIIPSGTQTFSKGPTQFVKGVAPIYLDRGLGSHVWDVDGNTYIDYSLALGPITLGYRYPEVDRAIKQQLKKGITFSLMHPLEIEVSQLLKEVIPCAEMVRFGKNGSDVTAGAVRLARAYTGRDKIACCGYHGWQDWYIGTTTRDKGVPKQTSSLTLPFTYNKIESLEKIFTENKGKVAAVIMEAIAIQEPKDGFLQKVKKLTHDNGALLIFDEIVTGFRIALGGAQEHYKIIPDLSCFGKGIANGMPLSALVGKKEIMKMLEEVFFSFTFGGEALSLAAAKATIGIMKNKGVIRHFWLQGRKLQDAYNQIAKDLELTKFTGCVGLPAHSALYFKDKNGEDSLLLKSIFQQEVLKDGILTIGVHNICYTLSDRDVKRTIDIYAAALRKLRTWLDSGKDLKVFLKGDMIRPIFRRW